MQQAEVELSGADRLNPLVAVDILQQYFNVRIGDAKAGDSVWDHANGGNPRKPEPDASDLASTCTLCSADSVGSVVQNDTNVLQKDPAGRCKRDQSFRTCEELDANVALKPTNFLTEIGLRNAQPRRRSREVEFLGDCDKKFQTSIFHGLVILNCFLIQQQESLGRVLAAEPTMQAVGSSATQRCYGVGT